MAGACSVGVGAICDAVKSLAGQAGVAVSDIDHFVFHQANERILSAAVKLLGVDDARVVRTLRSTGNISSACIPLALDSLVRSGELERGELVALVGFGAGLDTGPVCFAGSSDSHSKNQSARQTPTPKGQAKEKNMATDNTFERVCDIIRDNAGDDTVELTRDTTMAELGLDSLATVEVVVAIEGDLDIELDQSVNPETVGEFVDLVEAQLEK